MHYVPRNDPDVIKPGYETPEALLYNYLKVPAGQSIYIPIFSYEFYRSFKAHTLKRKIKRYVT